MIRRSTIPTRFASVLAMMRGIAMSDATTDLDPDCSRCRGGGCEWCGNTGRNRAIDRISWPSVMHPTPATTAPMRCNGVGRNAEWPKP